MLSGWKATSQTMFVDQVIKDERCSMHEFHGCGPVQCVICLAAHTFASKEHENGAEPLAACSERVFYEFVCFALFEPC